MINTIVVFQKQEDARGISNLLLRNGYNVSAVCTSGAMALSNIDEMDYGIIVCGYGFNDMKYFELAENLPDTFQMLLIASKMKLEEVNCEGVVSVSMPIKAYDLLDTLEVMSRALMDIKKKGKNKPKSRNTAQMAIIRQAKELLMETRKMTEEEAHRYLQKTSMESGTNIIETSRMVLEIMH